jgi:enoyl-CoA hydratase
VSDPPARLERGTADGVWRLTLDRLPVNAFGIELYRSVIAALDEVRADPDARCLVIRSAIDGAFSGGADTKELAALTAEPPDAPAWAEREALTAAYLERIEAIPVPVVAAIDGYAIGAGFVLASLCDIRIASRRAWFSIPELAVRRAGGPRHALQVLPEGTVRQLFFTGGRLEADRAYQLGFIEELVDTGTVDKRADAVAAEIARSSAPVLREAKEMLRRVRAAGPDGAAEVERLSSRRMAAEAFPDGGGHSGADPETKS